MRKKKAQFSNIFLASKLVTEPKKFDGTG